MDGSSPTIYIGANLTGGGWVGDGEEGDGCGTSYLIYLRSLPRYLFPLPNRLDQVKVGYLSIVNVLYYTHM